MTEAQARNLGALLRAARARSGKSFRALQAETGIPLATLKNFEDGTHMEPSPTTLLRLAEALQVDPDRINRISRNYLAEALPGVRTYFRSTAKLAPSDLDKIEAVLAEIEAGKSEVSS